MRKPWLYLILLLLVIPGVFGALGAWIRAQGNDALGQWVWVLGGVVCIAWLILGLMWWKDVRWVEKIRIWLTGLSLSALAVQIIAALGWSDGWIIWLGVVGMALTFVVGLWLARRLLSPGYAIIGVARTLLDEAIRMRLPVVLIVGVMVIVPVLPFVLDSGDRLEYRLQTFLSWSTMAVSLLLSLMTLFLAISTIVRELERKQVFLTMTKPITRWEYLVGKWLGIIVLNVVMVSTATVGIYAFSLYLEQQPARDEFDRLAIRERVLVARSATVPLPSDPELFPRLFEQRAELMQATKPETYGEPGTAMKDLSPEHLKEVRKALLNQWYSIGPRQTQTYVFENLGVAKETAQEVQLRLEPTARSNVQDTSGKVFLTFRINGRPYMPFGRPFIDFSPETVHSLWIPTHVIDENGRLEVEIFNPLLAGNIPQPTITFNTTDGLEVLYRVGSFGPNLARSMVMLWSRLCFLAMLGLLAGTTLSFPVAALACMTVFFAASSMGFLQESLEYYARFPIETLPFLDRVGLITGDIFENISKGESWDAVKIIVRIVGQSFAWVVPPFSEYAGGDLVANGRSVTLSHMGEAIWRVGLLWTVGLGLAAWYLFGRKELARVTV